MFGPALLVSPVTTYRRASRTRLSAAGHARGTTSGPASRARRPVDQRACAVRHDARARARRLDRAGRPELEYTDEKPADPVTLYVYAGADGAFTLYEDDGISYEYEKGASTRIRMTWEDRSKTLTIGAREGSFPGMLATRTFRVVLVTPESPSPFLGDTASARTVTYDGTAATVDLAGAR